MIVARLMDLMTCTMYDPLMLLTIYKTKFDDEKKQQKEIKSEIHDHMKKYLQLREATYAL